MIGPVTPEEVRRLSTGRWLIPILAAMAGEPGSRFGALARRLGVSRGVLSASLDALERFGWILRNSGHGHPLRPEYLLTMEGRRLGGWCGRVIAQRHALGLEQDRLGRWSLPLLFALEPQPQPFAGLQRDLAPVTPRALSLTLQQMEQTHLVGRAARLYALTGRGRDFAMPLLGSG